jgi:hypothetical protein
MVFLAATELRDHFKASIKVGSLGSFTIEIILESLEIPKHDYACKY